MKQISILLFAFTLLLPIASHADEPRVKTGIEVLKASKFKLLEGKRVGLITNPTGVDNNLKSTIDILHEAENVNLVALFGPEHGVRGNAHAGDKVDDVTDPKTGLPVFSLYGSSRKAKPEMVKGIDVLVYDIQDIGCRSFTYISTMGLAMQTAAEHGIEFVVLDRPNPLGGKKIEGNYTEDGFFSFVSQFKIPYIYGLTCGELAVMLNKEPSLGNKPCKLKVVQMKGWKRSMTYDKTGLQWVLSSPHIPNPETSFFYPVSGILGELYYLSIGVGYTIPFRMFGAEWINAVELANKLNALNLPGIIFRPMYAKPYYSVSVGKQIEGVEVHIPDYQKANLSEIQFYVMQEIARLYPQHDVLKNAEKSRFGMFDKVCGTDQIRELFAKRNRWEDAKAYWEKDVVDFRKLSKKYYLYR
ncbi:MAG: exo-beta-N-acetylmuramidase NamZ domain-containing protein [Paludibacteraceae bacterium]